MLKLNKILLRYCIIFVGSVLCFGLIGFNISVYADLLV
jgi:hypothetical protein